MGTEYDDYIKRAKAKHGDKFDGSNLNPAFIPYYNNGNRIEVDFGYENKRGRIGVTTGWRPVFLLMLTTRSIGSSYTIGMDDKVVKVISE